MARYDKYDPRDGGFRAPLNMDLTATSGPGSAGTPTNSDLSKVLVVGLNGSGRLVKATSTVIPRGVIIANGPMAAGDIADVMTHGEIVELAAVDLQAATAPVAGTGYYHENTAARLAATAPAAGAVGFLVGWTVEAGRLIVRCQHVGSVDA